MNQEKMMTKHNTKNIKDALSKFQEEANVAKKDKKNPYFKSTYAGLEDVIAAANQGAKLGLSFTQTIDYEKQLIDGVIDTTMYVTTILMHNESDEVIKSRYLIVPKNNNYADSQALGLLAKSFLASFPCKASCALSNSSFGELKPIKPFSVKTTLGRLLDPISLLAYDVSFITDLPCKNN